MVILSYLGIIHEIKIIPLCVYAQFVYFLDGGWWPTNIQQCTLHWISVASYNIIITGSYKNVNIAQYKIIYLQLVLISPGQITHLINLHVLCR